MKKHYASNQRLLDRVCYLSKMATKDTDLFGNEITVKHTFPYNPDSKTAPETAKRWANNDTYDYQKREYVKGPEPEFLERANDPFSVTIIDLDVRSEGGRAYKVVDTQGRCFDLREDQVLEVFKYSGILAGGEVPGQFVWGILGSQMRMVLVGGDLHKEMTAQAESLKEFKRDQALGRTPSEGTLQFGHIYRKRDQSLHLFLGRVKVPGGDKALFAFVKLPTKPTTYDGMDLDNLPHHQDEHVKHMREERAIAQRWDTMTWAERCQWEWHDSHDWLQRTYKDTEYGYYHHPEDIVLMASPKFEAEDGQDTDFAAVLRENAASKHKYVNGKGDDIAELAWQVSNGGNERDWHYGYRSGHGYSQDWYRVSDEERRRREREHHARVQVEYLACRVKFQKELEWVQTTTL